VQANSGEDCVAIYHLTANIISRARGQSVVAAAAYRCGAVLRDERYGVLHNYAGKRGVVHAEIMAPALTPSWARDREALWNKVEAGEARKDSQLARLIEVGLPIELDVAERVALVRDYIARQFIAKGMIADFCIRGDAHNPHAHILLTLRAVTASGFGPKERKWNGKSTLLEWRSAWAERANEHLARAGHAVRIDHRTLEAQQIELTPARRIGVGGARRSDTPLPSHLIDRIREQQRIARANGDTILEDPTVALRALTQQRPIFTHEELAQFLRSRAENPAQFEAVLNAVMGSADLVVLDSDGADRGRLTSRDLLEAHRSLARRTASMAVRRGHGVAVERRCAAFARYALNETQRHAFEYLVSDGDIKTVAVSEIDKDALLAAACGAWVDEGMAVMGGAPSDGMADRLQSQTGIESLSLSRWEEAVQQGSRTVTRGTLLLIDGSHMMALKQLERIVGVVDNARAKVVLVADADLLEALRVELPFRDLLRQVGPPHALESGA